MTKAQEDRNTYCLRCESCKGIASEPLGQCEPFGKGIGARYKQFIGRESVAEFVTFSEHWERVFDGIYCTPCARSIKTKNERQWQKKQEAINDR